MTCLLCCHDVRLACLSVFGIHLLIKVEMFDGELHVIGGRVIEREEGKEVDVDE